MRKIYELIVLFILVSLLTPMQGWAYTQKVIVKSEPSLGGYVKITNTKKVNNPVGTDVSHELTQTSSLPTTPKLFYLYCKAKDGYIFKGWSQTQTANSGNTDNPYFLSFTGNVTKTYYAIFARMKANITTHDFGLVTNCSPATKTITIDHAHAGQVSVSLDNNTDFSVNVTSFTSTLEGKQDIIVTFSPQSVGKKSATLTLHSDNGLTDKTITLSGEAVKNVLTWNEPINTSIQVNEQGRSITATATYGGNIEYSSSNTNVLSVNATTGVLTAHSEGEAIITASLPGGCSWATKSITKEFNVSDKKTPSFWMNNDANQTSESLYVEDAVEVNVNNIANGFTVSSSNSAVVSCSEVVNGVVTLTAIDGGDATITFYQPETNEVFEATREFTISSKKYTLSASINQSTATWDETISNPFTVTDDRRNNFSGYSVTAVNPSIADYVNGQIVTYSTNGKAQFTISYGETAKYNALSKTVDLSVAAAAESECYVVSQLDEITINNNTFNFNGGIGETLTCHLSGSTGWTPAVGTITITGNKADGSSTTLLTSKSEEFRNGIDKTIPLNSDITSITISYSGSYNAYVTNLKVTRSNYLNANATSVEAVGVPDGNPSRSFSVNYSDCGSTFNVRSSNPKITVSPTTFNVPVGNGSQTISFTGNTQATGIETATITVYNQSRKVEVPVTCYQQYKISFVTGQGASTVNPLIVTYDKAYTLPANPTKTGYTFAGWQKDGEKFVKGDTYTFANNITLTAVWTPKTYDLILDYKYTNAPANATRSGFFTYDAEYTFDEVPAENIHPIGYHFDGWYSDADCTQKFSLSGKYTTDGNTTIYAKWAPNKYGLTLYYNYVGAPNNGVLKTDATYFTFDAPYAIQEVPGENDHPTGYHFDGWYSDADYTNGVQWTSGTYQTDGATTLYAKWSVNTYTLTFVLNGGNWVNTDQSNQTTLTYGQTYGDQLASEKIERSGYTFQGWFSDANFATDSKVEANDVVGLIPPTTLYAKWLINALTATFDANYPNDRQGAAYSFSSSVRIGETYTLPETNPSIDGYAFAGWRTETNIMVDASTFCQIGKNHTLYGCWTANSYEVSYDPNQGNWSGNGQPTKVNLTYDQTYGQDSKFPAAPTRDGYTFQGWWTAADGGKQVTAETVMETAAAHTLYAHWSSNQYKLIFDYKDEAGTTVPVGVTFDANYPAVSAYPTQPVRTGFSFVGWYNAANEPIDLYELPNKKYTTVGNERFFAHWIPNHYTVKFKTDANSEVIDSMSISVAYHDVYGILPKLKENGQEVTTEWYDAPTNGMLITPTTIFQPANVNDNQEFILYATTNPEKFALQLVDGNQTTTIGISEGQTYADALKAAGIKKEETGKTFKGWSATQNGTPKVLSEAFSEDCQTLYALWEKTQLQVSFADGEHTNADYGVLTLAYGDTYGTGTRLNAAQAGLPSVAEVTGKTFKGWAYADNMFVNNTTPATFTTDDHTLTAVWMANNYTIYLHDAQANKTSTIDVTYGADYTLATPAAVNGYTFDGWYEDNNSTAFAHNGTYTQSADIHLYAHWTAKSDITVSFNANGGSAVANSISATYGQAYGNLPTTTKEGYTFVGWFTAAEGGTEVTNTTICKQTANHNLYAHWTAINYTIYLHENTGVDKTSAIDVTYGQTYTLTAPAERTGYEFAGWFTKQEGGDRYDLTTRTYETVGNLDLYAHWTAVSGITVSFNADGGEAVANNISATYGQAYGELPTTTKNGYTFVGWFNADGNIVASTDICRNATSHTLTAHWTATAYTITFDANGGECHTTNKQVVYNTAIGKLPLATRDGYTFNGWWANKATEATKEEDIFAGLENLTLKADWEACQYTVSFLPEGGTTTADNKQVTYQAEYGDLPTATRDGYTFDGWFTCDNERIMSDTKYTNIGNQELHAHWTAEKYTVTFSVPDKATLSTSSMEVTFDSPYGELPTPTLAGYVFTGWYSAELEGSLVSHSTIVSTAQAHMLYAHWTEADITIHFNSNGGSKVADQTRKYEGLYCEPALPTPTREGYTLIGWYLEDGTLVTSTTTVDRTEAHTLTAYWAQAGVPYLVLGDNWKISSPEADNDYRFKLGQDGHYHLSNIRVDAERSLDGEPTVYQADITIFLNGVFYGVEQGQTGVLQTTENGNSCLFTANSSERATIQSAEMLTRWFNFDLYEVSSGTWQLSISCGKQGNPTEVDNNESEQPARAKKYIDDGKVFIQTKEDRIYNASGQLVK